MNCSAFGRADRGDGDIMSSQDQLALRSEMLAERQERGGGGARSLSSVAFTFELISMLQVLQISALDVQSYNPRLYHILYTEQSLKPLNLNKERAIKSIYRGWNFLPSVRFFAPRVPTFSRTREKTSSKL